MSCFDVWAPLPELHLAQVPASAFNIGLGKAAYVLNFDLDIHHFIGNPAIARPPFSWSCLFLLLLVSRFATQSEAAIELRLDDSTVRHGVVTERLGSPRHALKSYVVVYSPTTSSR